MLMKFVLQLSLSRISHAIELRVEIISSTIPGSSLNLDQLFPSAIKPSFSQTRDFHLRQDLTKLFFEQLTDCHQFVIIKLVEIASETQKWDVGKVIWQFGHAMIEDTQSEER
jgi:hypothetical protein